VRILRLVYDWPPPWEGLAPGPYEISRAQAKLGHRVTVFCGSPVWGRRGAGLKAGGEGISVFPFPRAIRRFSLFFTTSPAVLLGYFFHRLRHKVDLVHGHGHITFWFNLYKLFFGWLDRTPYVLHLHITARGRAQRARQKGSVLDFWTRWFEWPLHGFSDWLGVRVADAVVCVSAAVKGEALELYRADPQKVFVVENGVNTELFTKLNESVDRTDHVSVHSVLYVGALSERKNVHLLIEAMRFLPPEYHLTIVGRGVQEYEDRLRRLVGAAKLQDRVLFEGYVEYCQLPPLYRDARILVLPSSYEGLPKVVFEALASGVLVLASGFKLGREIRGLEFLKDLNPPAIAARIKRVLERGVSVDVAAVRDSYSWDGVARRLEEVYSGIGC